MAFLAGLWGVSSDSEAIGQKRGAVGASLAVPLLSLPVSRPVGCWWLSPSSLLAGVLPFPTARPFGWLCLRAWLLVAVVAVGLFGGPLLRRARASFDYIGIKDRLGQKVNFDNSLF